MDDVFIERLVTRKAGGKEIAIKLGAVALVVFVGVGSFVVPGLNMLAPLLLVGCAWLGWMLWSRSNLEYEYSLSNGELTIDVIYGQRKRKHVTAVVLRERLEIAAPVNNDFQSELARQASKVLDVASSPNAPGRWFMLVKGETGLTKIFFEPDEKLIAAMRRAAPSKIKGI